ncbi:MAG: type II toxin-antitoxin system Phd/YefM family antitoxin [Candidatus Dormibacteraceae bacterium]
MIERARQRQEPVIITQRGRDVAVLVPIELYWTMERHMVPRVVSPHLVRPEDAGRFQMHMTVVDPSTGASDATI